MGNAVPCHFLRAISFVNVDLTSEPCGNFWTTKETYIITIWLYPGRNDQKSHHAIICPTAGTWFISIRIHTISTGCCDSIDSRLYSIVALKRILPVMISADHSLWFCADSVMHAAVHHSYQDMAMCIHKEQFRILRFFSKRWAPLQTVGVCPYNSRKDSWAFTGKMGKINHLNYSSYKWDVTCRNFVS